MIYVIINSKMRDINIECLLGEILIKLELKWRNKLVKGMFSGRKYYPYISVIGWTPLIGQKKDV